MTRANDGECETCDGEGVVVVDSFVNGRERQDEEPCPDCHGGDDFDDRDPGEDFGDYNGREPDALRSWL